MMSPINSFTDVERWRSWRMSLWVGTLSIPYGISYWHSLLHSTG